MWVPMWLMDVIPANSPHTPAPTPTGKQDITGPVADVNLMARVLGRSLGGRGVWLSMVLNMA